MVPSFLRYNARYIGKDCGRRCKRCAEEGSARVHEWLLIPSCTGQLAIETAKIQDSPLSNIPGLSSI